ncbi:hypothetical protein D3C87_728660 [compost metagenome]
MWGIAGELNTKKCIYGIPMSNKSNHLMNNNQIYEKKSTYFAGDICNESFDLPNTCNNYFYLCCIR